MDLPVFNFLPDIKTVDTTKPNDIQLANTLAEISVNLGNVEFALQQVTEKYAPIMDVRSRALIARASDAVGAQARRARDAANASGAVSGVRAAAA